MVGDRQGLGREGGLSHTSCPGRASAREQRSGTQGDMPRYKIQYRAAYVLRRVPADPTCEFLSADLGQALDRCLVPLRFPRLGRVQLRVN
jgi:hypothetical protein